MENKKMTELQAREPKAMTVKEVASAMGVSADTVKNCIRRTMPNKMQNGKTTFLDEKEVACISKELKMNGQVLNHLTYEDSSQVKSTVTDLEILENYKKANADFVALLERKYEEERAARVKAEQTNAVLMHVNKTYTATEIAKELGMKSAAELNQRLAEKRIQFKQNDTWLPFSGYADCGYFEIKQEVLDSGKVIYHRRITQLGREFILGLFGISLSQAR